MAVPKRRTSHSRQGHRRSHHRLTAKGIQYCPKCQDAVLPHRVCGNCGNYQGRDAVIMKDETESKGK